MAQVFGDLAAFEAIVPVEPLIGDIVLEAPRLSRRL
jgi:hypothetical protein